MKRTILILILLTPLILQAQDKIIPFSTIEMGYMDRYVSIARVIDLKPVDLNTSKFLRYKMYSDIHIGASWRNISLYTNVITYFYPDFKRLNFKPTQGIYILGVRYKYKKLEFNYEHMCSHGIDEKVFRDGYDRISVKIKIF